MPILERAVHIDYTNHRGERSNRTIVPEYLWWGKTQWYPEEQWLLNAFDVKKGVYRDFAFNHINGPAREEIVRTARIDERRGDAPKEPA